MAFLSVPQVSEESKTSKKAIKDKISGVPQEDFHSSNTSLVIPAAGNVVALTIYSIVAGFCLWCPAASSRSHTEAFRDTRSLCLSTGFCAARSGNSPRAARGGRCLHHALHRLHRRGVRAVLGGGGRLRAVPVRRLPGRCRRLRGGRGLRLRRAAAPERSSARHGRGGRGGLRPVPAPTAAGRPHAIADGVPKEARQLSLPLLGLPVEVVNRDNS
ncbi:RNA-binding protein 24 isoform X4 [Melospiza melodia melodia]|uniref:RNA-binding protein 24 isoform X4 n=1 Tax=Melospiza melodia melodia TaxID=1914991 RepID=UPI002FD2981C